MAEKELEIPGTIAIQDSFTAIAIRTNDNQGSSVHATIDGDTVDILLDSDGPAYTYFLSFDSATVSISLLLDSGSYQIFMINSGLAPLINDSYRQGFTNGCDEIFTSIPQSEWRVGLPAPSYSRSFTPVEHVVIHHAAGSNSAPDYTKVVRDIYVYHTEVNGWSDIGYNYLIAQDGSIYNGRDPAGGPQDNVLGAHFCGANSNTMGICLLGNYETANPSSLTLASLQNIITYKLKKENLTPYSQHTHALGQFEAIIGHRDGCSTLCPGGNVYEMIDQIKIEVMTQLENDCSNEQTRSLDFMADQQIIDVGESINYTNKSTGYESFQWVFDGGNPTTANWAEGGLVQYQVPGVYSVTLIGVFENDSDTLKIENQVEVQGDPVVYPNPIQALNTLHISYPFEILGIDLISLTGKQFRLNKVENGAYQLPYLGSGIYLLNILTPRENFQRKVRIN